MSIFDSIPLPKLKRSTFNLSHDVKLTAELGKLVPVLCQPVLPGDKWNLSSQFLCRVSPLLAPLMHRVNVYFHTFFVPNRLVWSHWEDYITQGVNGKDKPVLPFFNPYQMASCYVHQTSDFKDIKDFRLGSLGDYIGLPTNRFAYIDAGIDTNTKISQLPFRAYQLIYNEYYRDETLQEEVDIQVDSDGMLKDNPKSYNEGGKVWNYNDLSILKLQNRCWRKDYFSGALPWPQRLADAEVTLPIVGEADIVKKGSFETPSQNPYSGDDLLQPSMGGVDNLFDLEIDSSGFLKATNYNGSLHMAGINLNQLLTDRQIKHLKADLSTGNSVTINQLREAVRLQMWLENNARGGSRYIEQLLSHFGVISSDARLQRPEYLGGYSSDLQFTEVLQTSESTQNSSQGNQTGHGFALNGDKIGKRYFDEHGYIFVIMSIRPQNGYFQGIPKDFTKTDNLDFYFPEFQHLGEQEIKEREIYYSGNDWDDQTFGYVPRYSEYKTCFNRVCSDFRDSMDYYHLARIFKNPPKLGDKFVKIDEQSDEMDRIFPVLKDADTGKEYQHYWFDIAFNIKCSRKMSRYGIPKLI